MSNATLADARVGEIAASLAGATGVFRTFHIDFCCKGDIPLREAAEQKGVDLQTLLAQLQELNTGATDAPEDNGELIEHILERYHETHRRELPELIKLARKVEAVHGAHPKAPHGLAEHLQIMAAELQNHMLKEEAILFPMMRRGAATVYGPINMMRMEHEDHGVALAQLAQLTDDFSLPEGACRSWQALYMGVAKLVDDLMAHIHLENNVLFPRFEQVGVGHDPGH